MFISKLSLTGFHSLLSLLLYKFLAFTVKQGSPAGFYFFSLPFIPCRDFSSHHFPLSFSHTQSIPHSQQDGCLFNPKPLMEGAHCLWSTYSRWVNMSQLKPLFFFTPWPQLKKGQVGLAKSLGRAWQGLCSSSSLWLFRISCSGVRAPGWYNCTLCFYKYQL